MAFRGGHFDLVSELDSQGARNTADMVCFATTRGLIMGGYDSVVGEV